MFRDVDVLSFDLDDTLWPCHSVIIKAEKKLFEFLQKKQPIITRLYPSVSALVEHRQQLLIKYPQYAYDVSKIRRLQLSALAQEADVAGDWEEEAFECFHSARQKVSFYEDVLPTLERLSTKYTLIALTNGNADIDAVGLGEYFEWSLLASEAGAAKPDAKFFEAALERLDVTADRCLHIGDNLVTDVEGAASVAMKTAWLNRKGESIKSAKVLPDIVVSDLFELAEYL